MQNLIISHKMLNITGISNEKTNELTSLFQVQKKLKGSRSSELNFSSSCFIANDSHVKIVWLHVVAFSEHDILHF